MSAGGTSLFLPPISIEVAKLQSDKTRPSITGAEGAHVCCRRHAESSMTRAFLRCLPRAPTLCTVLCHRSTDGSHAMTPDNAARSRLSAPQETVLWLAIAGILTAAIGFSWNPTLLAQALAAIFIACALVHAAVAYGARRALVLFVACNAMALAMQWLLRLTPSAPLRAFHSASIISRSVRTCRMSASFQSS